MNLATCKSDTYPSLLRISRNRDPRDFQKLALCQWRSHVLYSIATTAVLINTCHQLKAQHFSCIVIVPINISIIKSKFKTPNFSPRVCYTFPTLKHNWFSMFEYVPFKSPFWNLFDRVVDAPCQSLFVWKNFKRLRTNCTHSYTHCFQLLRRWQKWQFQSFWSHVSIFLKSSSAIFV